MKKIKEKNDLFRNASILTVFFVALVIGIIAVASVGNIPLYNEKLRNMEIDVEYDVIKLSPMNPVWAEATPAGGGILSIYLHPHQASPSVAYVENSSTNLENNCTNNAFNYSNADNSEEDLIHSTTFDIVVRVRGESDHCKRDTVWYDTDLRVRISCASLGITADTDLGSAGNYTTTANVSGYTYLYMNFWDCGSAGYTLAKDETVEITSIKYEAYYS